MARLVRRHVRGVSGERGRHAVAARDEREHERDLGPRDDGALRHDALVHERRAALRQCGIERHLVVPGPCDDCPRHDVSSPPNARHDLSRVRRVDVQRVCVMNGAAHDRRRQRPRDEQSPEAPRRHPPAREDGRSHTSCTAGSTTRYGSTMTATRARMICPAGTHGAVDAAQPAAGDGEDRHHEEPASRAPPPRPPAPRAPPTSSALRGRRLR